MNTSLTGIKASTARSANGDRLIAKPMRLLPIIGMVLVITLWGGASVIAEEIVSLRTGQLFLAVTDLELQAGAMPLRAGRTLHTGEIPPGLLGSRWRLNWESTLSVEGDIILVQDAWGPMFFKQEEESNLFVDLSGEKIVLEKDGRALRTRLDGSIYIYDPQGCLGEIRDANGNTTTLRYQADGRLVGIKGPGDGQIELHYGDNDCVDMVTASTGAVVQYRYVNGNLVEVQSNGDPPLKYRYDDKGRLIHIERPESGAVELDYDDRSRVVSRRWADGTGERYQYDDDTKTVRHTNAAGGMSTIQRSKDGRQEEITDPLGNITVIEYNERGMPVVVTGPTGSTSTFHYDARGRVVAMKSCCGNDVRLEYVGDTFRLNSMTRADGTRQEFTYDARGNLLSIKEGGEVVQAFAYYPDGLLKSIQHDHAPARIFTYDLNGRVKTQTDALGHMFRYEYDKQGNLLRATDPQGGVTSWTYDQQGRVLSETDPSGATTHYAYDSAGRCVSVMDSARGITRFQYDTRGRLAAETDPLGRTTRYVFSATDQLASIIDPAGNVLRYDYDQAGQLVRAVNPAGGDFTYAYDALGRETTRTDPGGGTWWYEYADEGMTSVVIGPTGATTKATYDPQSRERRVTTPTGAVVHAQYDEQGRLIKAVTPGEGTVVYTYDHLGNLLSREEQGRGKAQYRYDPLNRLIEETIPTGLQIRYRYDAVGNLVQLQDSLGATATMQYNAQGLMTHQVDPLGGHAQYQYDPAGRLRAHVDPLGAVTRMAYNPAGELVEVTWPSGDTVTYEYDATGLLNTLHHPGGGVTRFERNALGLVVRTTDPLGQITQRAYDAMGRLVRDLDAQGRSIIYGYDAAGRLIEKKRPDDSVVHYRHDAADNVIEINDGVFPVRYQYDETGKMTAIEYPAIKRRFQYEYSEQGHLTRTTDSEGRTIDYRYDGAGRLTELRLPEKDSIQLAYDKTNRLTSLTYPNGVSGQWQYDKLGRCTEIAYTDASGTMIAGWRYSYDAAGSPVAVQEASGKETAFRYSAAGQLIQEQSPAGTKDYRYLPGGNRASVQDNGTLTEYSYNIADQLLQAGDLRFAHDAAGNLTEKSGPKGTTIYGYDAENQLVLVRMPDGEQVTFGYAPTGERLWREDASGRTWFVTDGLNLRAELDGDLNPTASYLHGPGIDEPLVMWKNGRAYYYLVDCLGSVAALTDEKGVVVASYRTDAFGSLLDQKDEIHNPFIFTGREYEPELGLYYYRTRYYDPDLGRFLSEDSEWHLPTPNPYIYVLNAPTRYRDPLGLTEQAKLQRQINGLVRAEARRERLIAPKTWGPKGAQETAKAIIRNQLEDLPPGLSVEEATKILRSVTAERLTHYRKNIPYQERANRLKLGKYYETLGSQSPSPQGPAPEVPTASGKSYSNLYDNPLAPRESAVQGPGYEPPPPRPGQAQQAMNATRIGRLGDQRSPRQTRIGPRPQERPPRPRPGPLTRGQASVQQPGVMSDLANPNRPLTGQEIKALGLLGALLTAEYVQNCVYNRIDPVDCVMTAVAGLAIGGATLAATAALIGATPAVILALAATIVTHFPVTEGMKLADERSKWEQAALNEELAKLRTEYFQNLLKNSQDKFAKWKNDMDVDMDAAFKSARAACDNALSAADEIKQKGVKAEAEAQNIPSNLRGEVFGAANDCDRADTTRGEIEELRMRIEQYTEKALAGLQAASGWAAECDSLATADRIIRMYDQCDGLIDGIVSLSQRARAANGQLVKYKTAAAAARRKIPSAVAQRDKIVALASNISSLQQVFEAKAAEFEKQKASLLAKRDAWLGKVSTLVEVFPAGVVPPESGYEQLQVDVSALRARATSMAKIDCGIADARAAVKEGVSRAVTATEAARTRVSGEVEGMQDYLTTCAGLSADDAMGAITASVNKVLQARGQYADLPARAEQCAQRVEEEYTKGQQAKRGKPSDSSSDGEDFAQRFSDREQRRTGEVSQRTDRDQYAPPDSGRRRKPTTMSQEEFEELLRLFDRLDQKEHEEISKQKRDEYAARDKTKEPDAKTPGAEEAGIGIEVVKTKDPVEEGKCRIVSGQLVRVEGYPERIAGMTVQLTGPVNRSTTSSGGGQFSFPDIPAGEYTISVTGWNYGMTSQSFTAPSAKAIKIVLKGSCPYLYVWTGEKFQKENDIYSVARLRPMEVVNALDPRRHSDTDFMIHRVSLENIPTWLRKEKSYRDYYRINSQPEPDLSGNYWIKIVERAGEHSFTDLVSLWAVEEKPGYAMGVARSGRLFYYGMLTPVECNSNVEEPANSVEPIMLYDGQSVEVTLPGEVFRDGVLAITWQGFQTGEAAGHSSSSGRPSLALQRRDPKGKWQTVDWVYPRDEVEQAFLMLEAKDPSWDAGDTVRLLAKSCSREKFHRIDRLAWGHIAGTQPRRVTMPLVWARGPGNHEVHQAITAADGASLRLGPSEEAIVQFDGSLLESNKSYAFVFVSEGCYIPAANLLVVARDIREAKTESISEDHASADQ